MRRRDGKEVAKREARREACKRLMKLHPDDWRVIYDEELKKRGIGYNPPRPTR